MLKTVQHKKKFWRFITILSFLLPAFLFYIIFIIYPIFDSIKISLTDWNGILPESNFVGLDNYKTLMQDKLFWNALKNTFVWVVLQLLIIALPTLVLALMVTKVKVGMSFFRTAFYLPAIVSFSVAAVIWAKIYDPLIGPVNGVLNAVGLEVLTKNWLGDAKTVLLALVVASSWVQYGAYMVMYITGLQHIDPQYYEAAELDGASSFQKFFNITIPCLSNSINVVISLIIINAFRGFSMVWATTQGGPFYTSDLISTFIFREGFTSNRIGTGTAGGITLTIIIVGVTVLFNAIRDWRAKK